MSAFTWPWLSIAFGTPLLGALLLQFIHNARWRRAMALTASAIALVASWCAWIELGQHRAEVMRDAWLSKLSWSGIGVVNFATITLIGLTALSAFALLGSMTKAKRKRVSSPMFLLTQACGMAVLSAHGLLALCCLSILLAALPLLPSPRSAGWIRMYAIYHLPFVLLLVSTAAVHYLFGADAQGISVTLLALAGAVRAGLPPFRGWVRGLFASSPIALALLQVLPMTGALLVLEAFDEHALPEAVRLGLEALCGIALIYNSLAATIQRDARGVLACFAMNHSALILLGVLAPSPVAHVGALAIWATSSLALVALGLSISAVEIRIGALHLDRFHGMQKHMPALAGIFLLSCLASVGFPGTIGFLGLEMLADATATISLSMGVCVAIYIAFSGIAALRLYFRLFGGPERHSDLRLESRAREFIAVAILGIALVGLSLFPRVFLPPIDLHPESHPTPTPAAPSSPEHR